MFNTTGNTAAMIHLTVTPEEAYAQLQTIGHKKFRGALDTHWAVTEPSLVSIPSVCWLFCWAKTGLNSPKTAEAVQEIFSAILDISFEDFNRLVPHQWAKNIRYATRDVSADLGAWLSSRNITDAAPPTDVAVDMAEIAQRVETTTYRILRDTTLARDVKRMHNYKCQIRDCDHTLILPDGSHYAEAHHIKPLGEPHRGPDIKSNILCVCPNHHAALDYRVIRLDIASLRTAPGHDVGQEYINYHNEDIVPR